MLKLAGVVLGLVCACGDSARPPQTLSPTSAALSLGAAPFAIDEHGVPQLLRFTTAPKLPGATPTDVARAHVERMLPAWGTSDPADLVGIGEVAMPGGTIVRFAQQIDGLPIQGREVRAFVTPDGGLVAISGAAIGKPGRRATKFRTTEAEAVAAAVTHELGVAIDPSALTTHARGDLAIVQGTSGGVTIAEAGARRVWTLQGSSLVAAWSIDARAGSATSKSSSGFHLELAADDGRVLARRDLVANDTYNYRVYAETTGELHPFDNPLADFTPHPTGTPTTAYPALTTPNLVSVEGLNHLHDPWLPSGATVTNGNSVHAYTDANPPDGFSAGDFEADVTAPLTFDRTYDFTKGPLDSDNQQKTAITSLFFTINWLHDFWYDHGFTEVAGNAQASNYGRGGVEGDPMDTEAEDDALSSDSRNNANMYTPQDGMSPRLQVYVWDGPANAKLTSGALAPAVGSADFGPKAFTITAGLVVAVDGTDPSSDACEPLTNVVSGMIVIADRGTCTFKTKALNVQNAGGVGLIIVDNVSSYVPPTLHDDPTITTPITIGALSLTMADSAQWKSLASTSANATMSRDPAPDLDGDLDASVLAHEFGHYIHYRLSSCSTALCAAMSEGWGDFDALLMIVRDGDNYDGAYPIGTYSTVSFAPQAGYFGIRRMPYSTNPAINGLSFRHMAAGEPMPTGIPLIDLGNNAEAHNAGEIWAETLFESYIGLIKASSWTVARDKMASYVAGGLMMAPVDATPTEMRDSILAVAKAANPDDAATIAQAFAKRGMGGCAVSPARMSQDFSGIVESMTLTGRLVPGDPTVEDSIKTCDSDGVLDSGETAKLEITIANGGVSTVTNANIVIGSTTPGVTVSDGTLTIASLDPGATMTVTATVSLADGVTDAIAGDFTAMLSGDNACDPFTMALPIRLNVDDVPSESTTDSFDAATSVWTADPAGWVHIRPTALDGKWHIDDFGTFGEWTIESPMLKSNGNMTMTFTHTYDFEPTYDGGNIEIELEGSTDWKDITTYASDPGYGPALVGDGPLANSPAFSGQNPSFPNADTVKVDFSDKLSGKS
ncbi:MAG TPA: M36 family metallopeptidase, partial [Kofleriaceae bacterium]